MVTLGPTAQATLVSTKNKIFFHPKSKQDDHLTSKTIILKHSEKSTISDYMFFCEFLGQDETKQTQFVQYKTNQIEGFFE
jgi:hypothetical protein